GPRSTRRSRSSRNWRGRGSRKWPLRPLSLEADGEQRRALQVEAQHVTACRQLLQPALLPRNPVAEGIALDHRGLVFRVAAHAVAFLGQQLDTERPPGTVRVDRDVGAVSQVEWLECHLPNTVERPGHAGLFAPGQGTEAGEAVQGDGSHADPAAL